MPEEEIRDVMHAVTFLQQQPEVEPGHIGLIGWGLGGGIVISAAARDPRVNAVVCASGLGDAGRVTRDGVPYESWLKRQTEVAADRIKRVLTGESTYISYTDVVHPGVEEVLEGRSALEKRERDEFRNIMERAVGETSEAGRLGHGLPDMFTLESAEALYNFRPEFEAHQISPRPVLIVHGSDDTYYPVDEAYSLYERAKDPKELVIIPGGEHLGWLDNPQYQPYVARIVLWFQHHIPPLGVSA